MENSELPWKEIIERLYRRQDARAIFNDLKRRRIIVFSEKENLELINKMKEKVESFRLKH